MPHIEWEEKVHETPDEIDTTKPHRYLEVYQDPSVPSGYGWQQGALAPDPDDEPEEDGIYVDSERDVWVRSNGLWAVHSDIEFFDQGSFKTVGSKWEDDPVLYAPFRKITIVERGH